MAFQGDNFRHLRLYEATQAICLWYLPVGYGREKSRDVARSDGRLAPMRIVIHGRVGVFELFQKMSRARGLDYGLFYS